MNLYALMFYNVICFRFPNEMSPIARKKRKSPQHFFSLMSCVHKRDSPDSPFCVW